ncbi:serine/threonine protein kinase [Streptomyces spororaveus]|uniref:serine/threonine protein kinase n=1 Tax=Streptomyces spororaveus TaxID=284039 RepID=UPI003799700D
MADVFDAVHKLTQTPVVLKQLHGKHPAPRKMARMKREIEIGRLLSDHPHAMPIWDAGPGSNWFVMPKAQATARECLDELLDPAALRDLVDSICSVLAAAHEMRDPSSPHGWVHRDIKPSNVLRLDGRWVLADWGLTRRPPGQTTDPQRTKIGVSMGSLGYAAPELSDNAHQAGPQADIYSLGQLIGWAVTGEEPLQNVPLIPPAGPWRAVVREATRLDPSRRPGNMSVFLKLIAQEVDEPPVPPVVEGEALRDAVLAGDPNAPERLLALAAAHPENAALYCDVLLRVEPEALMPVMMADPPRAVEIVRAMSALLGTHRPPESGEVDAVILWLFAVARQAVDSAEMHLLEECCDGAFGWDALWDQWRPQDMIRPWLRTLTKDAAAAVAGALRDHPDCARHFSSLAADVHVDHRIRSAVSDASGPRTSPTAVGSDRGIAQGSESRRVAVTVVPEVQEDGHISPISHLAYQQIVGDRLVSLFGTGAVRPSDSKRSAGYDFDVTVEGRKIGVETRFGDPNKMVPGQAILNRVRRAFDSTSDLDALIFVSSMKEPEPRHFAPALNHAQQLGKSVRYVRWADDGDTPALRGIAEE